MVSIFCEGFLDERVLRKIVQTATGLEVGLSVFGKGKPYLEMRSGQLNKSARGAPIIVLADLDDPKACPADLVVKWLEGQPKADQLLLRFAVLAVESWLLADAGELSAFLEVPTNKMPRDVDSVVAPKLKIVSLARSSKNRAIRDAVVPGKGSRALVGPNYTAEMTRFVENHWRLEVASRSSRSLNAAVRRLQELDHKLSRR